MFIRFVLGLLIFSFSTASIAQKTEGDDYKKRVEKRQNTATSVSYESVNKQKQQRDRWSDFLPILGKQAREQGYVLPLPFGVSLVGLTQQQDFSVSRIGLAFSGKENEQINIAVNNSINAKNVVTEDQTFNLRFDVWLLPFLNVYGLAGRTEGQTSLELDVSGEIPTTLLIGAGAGQGLGANRCQSVGLPYNPPPPTGGSCQLNFSRLPTTLNFHGTVLGYGTTIAGGYGDFFGMFDMNFSKADINIASQKTEQAVYSARIGWNGKAGSWEGQLWVGAMKQDIAQSLDIHLPGTDMAAVIDQKASDPYNYLIGSIWNINENWSLLMESSFLLSKRQQFMMQLGYRF